MQIIHLSTLTYLYILYIFHIHILYKYYIILFYISYHKNNPFSTFTFFLTCCFLSLSCFPTPHETASCTVLLRFRGYCFFWRHVSLINWSIMLCSIFNLMLYFFKLCDRHLIPPLNCTYWALLYTEFLKSWLHNDLPL